MSNRIRCAIYTRKSTEEGLDQDFNSLDAQRESCEAFIQSQRGLGWVAQKKQYNDGGISGGTMDRPALQTLLTDIEKGKVDLVVVYKVDRLTRSLMDFSKIIETFDARSISFVSVTQQFNTANSMGRLTLNVLLSFAQFEREVTAERIRDKIAASKKKGMWMGGLPPLGYDAVDKKLVINSDEAVIIRSLFDLYLEHKSIRNLKAAAGQLGYVTKRRKSGDKITGGKPFTRGHLSQVLNNPIYIGQIAHKEKIYPGQHLAIINSDIWQAVQQMLNDQAPQRQSATNSNHACVLTGLAFDETGDRLTPTYANKKGRRYRYYISKRLVDKEDTDGRGWRLPALELEKAITNAIVDFLSDEAQWMKAIDLADRSPADYNRLRLHIEKLVSGLSAPDGLTRKQGLSDILERATIKPGILSIILRRHALNLAQDANTQQLGHELSVPFHTKRRGVEYKIIIGGIKSQPAILDQNLIHAIRRSHEWLRLLAEEQDWSIDRLAKHVTMDASDVTRFLPLAFLSPYIVDAIVNGKQPVDLNLERLKKIGPIPFDWEAQKRLLGFQTPSNSTPL